MAQPTNARRRACSANPPATPPSAIATKTLNHELGQFFRIAIIPSSNWRINNCQLAESDFRDQSIHLTQNHLTSKLAQFFRIAFTATQTPAGNPVTP
jgi:hypothetical protein